MDLYVPKKEKFRQIINSGEAKREEGRREEQRRENRGERKKEKEKKF